MMTSALLALVLLIAMGVVVRVTRPSDGQWRFVVTRGCWIPAAALALEYAAPDQLAGALGYAGILVLLVTCGASFVLALIGVRVLLARHRRSERDAVLA
jgi:hypothetical protein